MKRLFKLCITILVIGLLSACVVNTSKPTEPVNSTKKEEKKVTKVNLGSPGVDASEILLKTAAAMKGVTSLMSVMDMVSESIIDGEASKFSTNIQAKEKLSDPAVQHAISTTIYGDGTESNMEYYISEGTLYMLDDMSNEWYTFPYDLGLGEEIESQRLDKFALMDGVFTGEEKGNNYIISFRGTDKQFKEITFDVAAAVFTAIEDDYFKNMVVTGTYTLEIEKKSFYLLSTSYEMEYTTASEFGEVLNFSKSTITNSEFNEHDTLAIPVEIIQSVE